MIYKQGLIPPARLNVAIETRGNDFGDDRARLEMGDNDSLRVYFEASHVPAGHASVIYRHNILEMEIWALETLKAVGKGTNEILVSAWHANHCKWHLNPIIFATMHFHEHANIRSEVEKGGIGGSEGTKRP